MILEKIGLPRRRDRWDAQLFRGQVGTKEKHSKPFHPDMDLNEEKHNKKEK